MFSGEHEKPTGLASLLYFLSWVFLVRLFKALGKRSAQSGFLKTARVLAYAERLCSLVPIGLLFVCVGILLVYWAACFAFAICPAYAVWKVVHLYRSVRSRTVSTRLREKEHRVWWAGTLLGPWLVFMKGLLSDCGLGPSRWSAEAARGWAGQRVSSEPTPLDRGEAWRLTYWCFTAWTLLGSLLMLVWRDPLFPVSPLEAAVYPTVWAVFTLVRLLPHVANAPRLDPVRFQNDGWFP